MGLPELALDVDTLWFVSFADEVTGRRVEGVEGGAEDGAVDGAEDCGSSQVLQNANLDLLDNAFDGVVVSSVAQGDLAWTAGVRAGIVLVATSPTLGSMLWPKSTLDDVRLAISSRKVTIATVDFKL